MLRSRVQKDHAHDNTEHGVEYGITVRLCHITCYSMYIHAVAIHHCVHHAVGTSTVHCIPVSEVTVQCMAV